MNADALDLAATILLEQLLLRGHPLYVLEDPDDLAAVVLADDGFRGFRRYGGSAMDAIRETALQEANRLAVAENLSDEP